MAGSTGSLGTGDVGTRAAARGVLVALLALGAVVAAWVLAPGSSGAASRVRVGVSLTCSPTTPYVRLADRSVVRVAHGAPGALRNRIGRQASDLYLVVRLSAPWTTVRAAPGTTFRVTADGPKGERWRWTFRTSSGNPESDSSGYVGCLRPMAGVVSFARHLRTVRGRWTFTVDVVGGRVKGASGAVAVTVR